MICGLAVANGSVCVDDETAFINTPSGVSYEVILAVLAFSIKDFIESGKQFPIYHHITEKGQTLFGFTSYRSRSLFIDLLTVQGVGPKVVSKLFRKCSYKDITTYIADKNITSLIASKGVGKKTAEKIIDKLSESFEEFKSDTDWVSATNPSPDVFDNPKIKDLLAATKKAVQKLGFTGAAVSKVMGLCLADMNLEDDFDMDIVASELLQKTFRKLREGVR